MKDFIKMFFASCLGATVAIIGLFMIALMIGALSTAGKDAPANDGLLVLDFKHIAVEKTGNVETDPFSFENIESLGLRDFCKVVAKAKTDSKIKGILIKADDVLVGHTMISTMVEALRDFKDSGKFIYAYADYYTQRNYYISSIADSIFLNPNGLVDLKGYGIMTAFFKDAMDKLDIEADVFYAGDFKSASEPFRRNNMSQESKLQAREFLHDLVNSMQIEIAENRGMTPEQIDQCMREYTGRNAHSALNSGLVDAVMYWSDVEDLIKVKLGKKPSASLIQTPFLTYKDQVSLLDKGPSDQKIAVVYAEGEVGYGEHKKGSITDQEYIKIFSKIRKDDKIKAVVFRVNSPGGSALTSDVIWDEIEKVKAKGIPVVASYGDYAASGGYYISVGADSIVSDPNTLTGSIGVFSVLPNFSNFFSDRLGITFDTVETHPLSVGYSGLLDLEPMERQVFVESTEAIYAKFLARVAQGRNMDIADVEKVAQGRVWTGSRALELGLVDRLGDLQSAIDMAARMANLEAYKVTEYPYIQLDFFEQLAKEISKGMREQNARMAQLTEKEAAILKFYQSHRSLFNAKGVQARLPFVLAYN